MRDRCGSLTFLQYVLDCPLHVHGLAVEPVRLSVIKGWSSTLDLDVSPELALHQLEQQMFHCNHITRPANIASNYDTSHCFVAAEYRTHFPLPDRAIVRSANKGTHAERTPRHCSP